MTAQVEPGRFTAASDRTDITVFLIGMRVNRWWKPWVWLRVAAAMPRMLRELSTRPELGYLGGESWFARTTLMVQYWRSTDALMAYAKMRDAAHLPAWQAFNRAVGTNGDVGIWHETYRVRAGESETSGGSRESETKLWQASPTGPSGPLAAATTTPVGKRPRTWRSRSGETCS